MGESLIERIKRWNKTRPNDMMGAFSSDLHEIVDRMEKAEKKAKECYEGASEFNSGFDAYQNGLSEHDEPRDTVYDQWLVGWAWAQYLDTRRDDYIKALVDTVDSMDELIDLIHRYDNGDPSVSFQVVREQMAKWVDAYYKVNEEKE